MVPMTSWSTYYYSPYPDNCRYYCSPGCCCCACRYCNHYHYCYDCGECCYYCCHYGGNCSSYCW